MKGSERIEVGAPGGIEPFVEKEEVAQRLKLGVRTVSNWMRRGWLPYYKIGRAVRFKWSEVEERLKGKC